MHNLIKLIILLILPFSMFGQISYLKHYSDDGYDAGQGVVQLEDSSYTICGHSSSFTNGPSQAFLMRVDSTGNLIWSNKYGGFESESARRVLYQKNFGYFLAGYTNSTGYGAYDCYLIKTDENGVKEWERTYGTAGWDRVNDAALTRDTGVIMVGVTNSNIATGEDMYIVRTDINGDTLWTKTIGDSGPDVATCIERYNDSLFVVGGHGFIQDSLKTKAILMYIKDDGTILDTDTLLNIYGEFELNDIDFANDTLQGTGSHRDTVGDTWDAAIYLVKVEANNLQPLAYYATTNTGDYWGDLITVYGPGTHRYIAMTNANHVNAYEFGPDLVIGKFSDWLQWQSQVVVLAELYPDIGGQLIPTSDGGAAMVGYREGVGEGGSCIFLLKIGPDEFYPTTVGVLATSPFVGIEEMIEFEYIKMYPNPASYSFQVEVPDTDNYEVNVFDMLGSHVLNHTATGNQKIDVSYLSAGTYTIHVLKDGVLVNMQKLMIE